MLAVRTPDEVLSDESDRSEYIRTRLRQLSRHASDLILETGVLLREVKQNATFRAWGYQSFDDAIDAMQRSGEVDFGSRNARNLIAIADMVERLHLTAADIRDLSISKLREAASLPEADQERLLTEAKDMSVAEVQKEAKRLRDKAAGRDTDPYDVFVLKTTATQKEFLVHCLREARRVYAINETVSDATVIVDHVLADWSSAIPQIEAEAIEADLT